VSSAVPAAQANRPSSSARSSASRSNGPSWIAFARENGTVYHTYTVMAPDPFVAPYYSFLLDRTPKPQPEEPRRLAERRVPGPGHVRSYRYMVGSPSVGERPPPDWPLDWHATAFEAAQTA
jgi:hypothetical protein